MPNITFIIKPTKMQERERIGILRDIKLKKLRKGKGAGRPLQATKGGKLTRTEINKMRDDLLKAIKKKKPKKICNYQ